MVMRISYENFIKYMIDYFPSNELLDMQYAIISANIKCGTRFTGAAKLNILYPQTDVQQEWIESRNIDYIRDEYIKYLKEPQCMRVLHDAFVQCVLDSVVVVILYRDDEASYIDVLAEFLKDRFCIPCLDLDKLFKNGISNSISVDLDDVHNSVVELRRELVKEAEEGYLSTSDGRAKLLLMMSKKEKAALIKELNIKIGRFDYRTMDEILTAEWVED